MFALHVHSTHLAGVLSPPFLPFSLASSARCCASAAAAALTSVACFCFLAASCSTADRSEPQAASQGNAGAPGLSGTGQDV